MSHSSINPAIHYWGTPVTLISTQNEDGTANIGPMSSVWWLGQRCMLGLLEVSKTTQNLLRTKQCVLNLPSDDMTSHVNALARTTGSHIVPDIKAMLGYRSETDKFGVAGLTPEQSELVDPPRIKECPVQMEAELVGVHEMSQDIKDGSRIPILAMEVKILRTYVLDALRLEGHANRIDPDAWRPLIMSFQQFYGLKPRKQAESSLAEIDEDKYRPPE